MFRILFGIGFGEICLDIHICTKTAARATWIKKGFRNDTGLIIEEQEYL
jgi:hypothetical protein